MRGSGVTAAVPLLRGGPLALAAAGLMAVLVIGAGATATWAAHAPAMGPADGASHLAAGPSAGLGNAGAVAAPAHGRPPGAPAVLARIHAPAPQPAVLPLRHLRIAGLGGGPVFDVVPFDEHGYLREADFAVIAHVFRAHNGCEVAIHPHLIEVLMELSSAFDDRPVVLVSGHREPGSGTRTSSYHVAGLAADIAIQGVRSYELYRAALRLGVPGIGRYGPFVHLDVRSDEPAYRWSGSWGRWRRRR